MKKFIVIFFILFIFLVPIITLLTPDKNYSDMENKILQKLPDVSFNNIISTKFMYDFDKYTSDQFPFRVDFIKIKNTYSYAIGQREFRNIYVCNNRLLEKFEFNKDIVDKNIADISNISNDLKTKYNINTKLIVIPTSIALYENLLKPYMKTDNQLDVLSYIEDKYLSSSSNSSFYTHLNI